MKEKITYCAGAKQNRVCVEKPSDLICIWKTYALFIGNLPEFGPRRQAAAAVCVGLEADIEISADEKTWHPCRSAMTGPEVDHAIRFQGRRCALLFIEPNTSDFTMLTSTNAGRERNGIFISLHEEPYLLDFLQKLDLTADLSSLQNRLESFTFIPGTAAQNNAPDARMQNIARQIARESAENIPVEKLATSLNMSVSSLEHLFKKEIGVPIRMFRTWFRLKATVLLLKEGLSLTEAALRAGFFDSAHFSRTFKEVFGLPPSEIFNPRRQIRWYVARDPLMPALL